MKGPANQTNHALFAIEQTLEMISTGPALTIAYKSPLRIESWFDFRSGPQIVQCEVVLIVRLEIDCGSDLEV